MLELHIQNKAKADLKGIWRYSYEKWGKEQADKYFDELSVGMDYLQDNPEIGFACDYIRTGYRQYQINKHLVFYRITQKQIRIIRVLHEKMDYQQHLQLKTGFL